jgi:hypothetical protein
MGFFDNMFGSKDKSTEPQEVVPSNVPDEILEEEFNSLLDKFANGGFGDGFDTDVMLKKGEKLIFEIPEISLCEERSVKMKGSHQGFSVRIAKGLSYRFGTFEGGTEQEVVELDLGTMTLTNKRLIFSGDTKSVEYNLSKIVSIKALDDGVMINRSGKTKTEYFYHTTNLGIALVNDEFNDGLYHPDKEKGQNFKPQKVRYEMNGIELKKLIQKLLQE